MRIALQEDLDTAQATHDGAVAQHKANQAAVNQAQANVNQAKVDLDHTIITAPIDGVVIARNVDVGQTVAASFTAPVLFVIANDLKHMQVNASIDEADIGRVRSGQGVTFRVDAYPDQTFRGRVDQVRLQPTTVQNVVTYNTIISVDNDDGKLMPGMTATVSVIVQKADNVLRIPAAALRFRPEGFEPGGRGARPSAAPPGAGAGAGAGGPRAAIAPGAGAPGAGGGRPGGGGFRRTGGQPGAPPTAAVMRRPLQPRVRARRQGPAPTGAGAARHLRRAVRRGEGRPGRGRPRRRRGRGRGRRAPIGPPAERLSLQQPLQPAIPAPPALRRS